jgi:hypothetical protein
MKNAVFWDVMPCGSCRNRRFEGKYLLLLLLRSVFRLLVTANIPSSSILVTLSMETMLSSETSVLTRTTRRNITEDSILTVCSRVL